MAVFFATKVAAAPAPNKPSNFDVLYNRYTPSEPKPKPAPTYTYCSCVTFAKALVGFSTPIGYARYWPRNSQIPQVGSVVITSEGPFGHVAVVESIEGNQLILTEANYAKCRKTSGRRLSIDSPYILGYWTP